MKNKGSYLIRFSLEIKWASFISTHKVLNKHQLLLQNCGCKLRKISLRCFHILENSNVIFVISPLALFFDHTRNHSLIYRLHFDSGKKITWHLSIWRAVFCFVLFGTTSLLSTSLPCPSKVNRQAGGMETLTSWVPLFINRKQCILVWKNTRLLHLAFSISTVSPQWVRPICNYVRYVMFKSH